MAHRVKIISVVGARPNFMKLAPIEKELRKHKRRVIHRIVHTGQHYDFKLSRIFFRDLELPEPHIYLGAGSSSHSDQTAKIMQRFERVISAERPDLVIVYGDVNSTLACSLVCSKVRHVSGETIPVAHVEAGLRSFDRTMPEEVNRIVTDCLSKYLFVTEKAGVENLLKEGTDKRKIFLAGDVLIDSLTGNKKKLRGSGTMRRFGLKPGKFMLFTLHRPSNVDSKRSLKKIISLLKKISAILTAGGNDFPVIFPVHPRTLKMLRKFGLYGPLKKIKNIRPEEPLGYTDFISLLGSSKLVITDSGGIQEEATFLRIPCLTLRNSFERPETIRLGTNTLCSLNEDIILKNVKKIIGGTYKKGSIPRLMDGRAAGRIVNVLLKSLFDRKIA